MNGTAAEWPDRTSSPPSKSKSKTGTVERPASAFVKLKTEAGATVLLHASKLFLPVHILEDWQQKGGAILPCGHGELFGTRCVIFSCEKQDEHLKTV